MDQCPLCHSADIEKISHDIQGGVTSDCVAFGHSSDFYVCKSCMGLFKDQNEAWQKNVSDIYANYKLYIQTGGEEQPVYNDKGEPIPRSRFVLDELKDKITFPASLRMLDIGCGTGAMLRAFHTVFPHGQMWGQDEHVKNKKTLESLPGVQDILTQPLSEIDQTFDAITLIHVLEHVFDPISFLQTLRPLLSPNGQLIIQVPDAQRNPFDLMVYDHATHFTPFTLHHLLTKAGYRVSLNKNLLPREITLVADLKDTLSVAPPAQDGPPLQHFDFLNKISQSFLNHQKLSVFGTAVAANWLSSIDDRRIIAYLDENPNMIGQTLEDKPVLHPDFGDKNAPVIVPFGKPTRSKIQQKLIDRGYKTVL